MLIYIRLFWVFIPCVILIFYCINMLFPFGWCKSFNLNNSQRKGLCYSSIFLWYLGFCLLFKEFIISVNLTDTYKITKEVYNYFVLSIVFIVISILLDLIFFKNINISKLNIKGIELTLDEVKDITESSIIRREDYALVNGVCIPNQDKLRVIFAHITTSFVFPDLLLMIKSNGDSLFEHEHLIIQNIISIFDAELYISTIED